MKKSFLILPALFLLGACAEPEPELPPVTPEAHSVKLTQEKSGLEGTTKTSPSTEEKVVELSIEGKSEKYEVIMGTKLYNHADHPQIVMLKDGYIKSKSQYSVDRLRIDYFSKQGTNFTVLDANNQEVTKHDSSVSPEYIDDSGEGNEEVLEYSINGTSWTITNTSDYKPSFYSITVIFTM